MIGMHFLHYLKYTCIFCTVIDSANTPAEVWDIRKIPKETKFFQACHVRYCNDQFCGCIISKFIIQLLWLFLKLSEDICNQFFTLMYR